MDIGVGLGFKLGGKKPAVVRGELTGLAVHPNAFFSPGCQYYLGAKEAHQPSSFNGKAVRHGDDQRVAPGCTHHGQADAGIARCGFDDGLPRLQFTAALRRLYDVQRQAILDRAEGVEGLDLNVNVHVVRGDTVQPDTGRIPHGPGDITVQLASARGGVGSCHAKRSLY